MWEDGQGRACYNGGLGKGHCVLRSIFTLFTEVARREQISFLRSSVLSFGPGNWLVLS